MPKLDFDTILLEAVDWGLSSLGESSKSAIYFHLLKSFNVRKEEIPSNVEAFEDAIEKIFGPGASFLEVLIIQRLREKIHAGPEVLDGGDFRLTDYVACARRNVLRRNGV